MFEIMPNKKSIRNTWNILFVTAIANSLLFKIKTKIHKNKYILFVLKQCIAPINYVQPTIGH